MLLKQWSLYFAGRIFPALIGFGAIALYTRLLDPASFGVSALLMSVAFVVGNTGYAWVRGSALRAAGSYDRIEPDFVATVLLAFTAMSVVVWGVLAVVVKLCNPTVPPYMVLITLVAATSYAWFELNASILQSRLRVLRYSLLQLSRAVVALGATLLMITAGAKAFALIGGFAAGNAVALIALRMWRPALEGRFDFVIVRRLFNFGWPVSLQQAALLAPAAQRYLLQFARGSVAVGVFSVASDFSAQTVGLLIATATLAGQPLAFQAKDRGGTEALARQLSKNAELVVAIALPAATAVALLAGPIASIYMGSHFRSNAAPVIALAAIATMLLGIRMSYFDQAFEIAYNTRPLPVITGVQAAVTIALSVLLIPAYGPIGAATAALVAQASAFAVSVVWGRACTSMPIPFRGWIKTALATAVMSAAILAVPGRGNIAGFAAAVLAGAAAYAAAVWILRREQIRAHLVRRAA